MENKRYIFVKPELKWVPWVGGIMLGIFVAWVLYLWAVI